MALAALLVAPFGLRSGHELVSAHIIRLGIVVAGLAALVPFSLELAALRQVPARVFGMLMSLSPVAATLSGFVLLGQRLTVLQGGAMATVTVASFATARGERVGETRLRHAEHGDAAASEHEADDLPPSEALMIEECREQHADRSALR